MVTFPCRTPPSRSVGVVDTACAMGKPLHRGRSQPLCEIRFATGAQKLQEYIRLKEAPKWGDYFVVV